jgi:hypothetical protein
VRRGGSTEPCEATTSVPTGVRASSRPHVPRRMMAIGPSTTARVSRTTKSIMGVPMPVLTNCPCTTVMFLMIEAG